MRLIAPARLALQSFSIGASIALLVVLRLILPSLLNHLIDAVYVPLVLVSLLAAQYYTHKLHDNRPAHYQVVVAVIV